MILKKEELELKVFPKFYDGNKEYRANMYIDDNGRIMYGLLIPGASIGMHKHETSSEIIFITKGEGKVIFEQDGKTKIEYFKAGEAHYCPKGCLHSLLNETDERLEFFAVVPNLN